MTLKWPSKANGETLDYTINWSRRLSSGETIASIEWYFYTSAGVKTNVGNLDTVNGLQHYGESYTNTTSTINLRSGTANTTYKITGAITTNSSPAKTLEEDVLIKIS